MGINRRFSRRRKRSYKIRDDGSKEIELTPEMEVLLDEQRVRFVEKFGREPTGDDPIFFDPDSDVPSPIKPNALPILGEYDALYRAGVSSPYIHAMKKTGRKVTQENHQFLTDAELDEWDAAYAEGCVLHPDNAPCGCALHLEYHGIERNW